MFISPKSRARRLQRLTSLKYNNVQKQESRFSLGLNAVKNTHYLKRFLIICIFGNIKPQTESTFPFQYDILFETHQSLEPPGSTPEGDRHVHPLTFLCGIHFSTTFPWSIFGYNAYFWQGRILKWVYFPIFVHYNISKMAIFGAP